jgi:hypothetical protein
VTGRVRWEEKFTIKETPGELNLNT